MSNRVDPDTRAHYEPSHLDLRCMQKSIIIACGSERVNVLFQHFVAMMIIYEPLRQKTYLWTCALIEVSDKFDRNLN